MPSVSINSRNLSEISVGELHAKHSARGDRIIRYFIRLRHNGLNQFKEVSAPDLIILQHKIDALMTSWDVRLDDARKKNKVLAGAETAEEMTQVAGDSLHQLGRILHHTLSVNDKIDWSILKDNSKFGKSSQFSEPPPRLQVAPDPVWLPPVITFADKLLLRAQKKTAEADLDFSARQNAKRVEDTRLARSFEQASASWAARKLAFDQEIAKELQDFHRTKAEHNQKIDDFVKTLSSGNVDAVIEHASLVLEQSNYKGLFEKSFELDYNERDRIMLVEYELPSPAQIPTLRSVKFVKATGELKEIHISDKEKAINFDSVCYQIALRTIHELFEADEWDHLRRIAFNGFATDVDPTTGLDVRSCILSVVADREEFEAIDLSRVEPKSCFKKLKGVSASSLSALVAIPPLVKMDRTDRRFIEERDAASSIDESTNLASMSWEDFEHLVRQLFEREFATRGGEVKVTQSSRDGGVDAIAFDPDPISGGKIVIQAKRYTRVVGVSAVRDLFGTVMNEGASKGILVTTADYGPDAHKFAMGKPLTLISGANLLFLLAKHGMKARIDLRDARRELSLREYD